VVDNGSPAFESGVQPGDLITHINGEAVQGLYHTQVLQLLLSGGDHVTIRSTPLENTSIRSGGRKREPWQSKLARRSMHRQRRQKRDHTEKRRKSSLFRRISSKRASVEMQQPIKVPGPLSAPILPVACVPQFMNQKSTRFGGWTILPNLVTILVTLLQSGIILCPLTAANSTLPSMATPSRSFQSIPRALVSQDAVSASPPHAKVLHSPPTNRITFSSPEPCLSPANSSQSSSPSSSTPNSPAGVPSNSTVHYQRPSTLHGLKHKLHSAAKSIHSPNRRKSVGHIPLSPLARTPSPSPLPSSPTRSPSPLAFPVGHHPGSSNTTQSYSPGTSLATPGTGSKKSYGRPKSAEPGSPLLRRALSPDRLHPRSAESKVKSSSSSISPLCNPDLKVTVSAAPRVTITSQSPPIPSRSNYTNLTDKPITSKPPEHPSAIRPEKEGTLDKLSRFIEPYQRPEIRDKRVTVDILPCTSAKKISVDESPHPKSNDFIKIDHRNPISVASNGSIVPTCDRTSQHLPRIAEEKDSPTGSKDDTTSKDLLKEVQNSSLDCLLLESKSNEVNTKVNAGTLKRNETIIKKSKTNIKNEGKGKTAAEDQTNTSRVENKSRKKDIREYTYTSKESPMKGSEKEPKKNANDLSKNNSESASNPLQGKWSAYEKRENFKRGQTKTNGFQLHSYTAFCKGQKQYPIGRKLGAVSETKEEDAHAVISKCLDIFKIHSRRSHNVKRPIVIYLTPALDWIVGDE
ncbi:unnamed protein product, partial [Timema podura]|nr:unnamed protein product [Timema podura]